MPSSHRLITKPVCRSEDAAFACTVDVRTEPPPIDHPPDEHKAYYLVQIASTGQPSCYQLIRPTIVLFFVAPDADLYIMDRAGIFYCSIYSDLPIYELRLQERLADQTLLGIHLQIWCVEEKRQVIQHEILVATLPAATTRH